MSESQFTREYKEGRGRQQSMRLGEVHMAMAGKFSLKMATRSPIYGRMFTLTRLPTPGMRLARLSGGSSTLPATGVPAAQREAVHFVAKNGGLRQNPRDIFVRGIHFPGMYSISFLCGAERQPAH